MQYSPDWRQQMTKAQFEQELSLMFLGPGIYTNGGDTVLIAPVHPFVEPGHCLASKTTNRPL